MFSAQAGRYAKAHELLEEAMEIEEKELGSRSERMMEMYYVAALLRDEVRTINTAV